MTIHVLPAQTRTEPASTCSADSLLTVEGADGSLTIVPSAARGTDQATGTAMATDDGKMRGLPSGLVTFVFTDIEASTRLYKVLGDQLAGDVFDLHNMVLRAAWDAFGGHEVHTEGDSFFVVFEDPNQAIAACIDVQERLAAVDWPPGGDVRVRIGIHCGLAAPRNDDYMALAVHQAARVMSAANGAQILVTDTILQRLDPFEDATITRAGRFRLRDFDVAPTIFRIDSTRLAPNVDPPRATPASHHNLVSRLTSFVGRDGDLEAVAELLAPSTAVTVAGLGGMGKTRLAVEVGLHVAPSYEHGAWMVELAEVAEPELIAEEVAAAIGVDSTSVGDRWDDVIDFIGDKAMLLILDNAEHLVGEVAELVPRLLRACTNIAVLSTTREPLNCQGEVVYRLNPLDVTLDGDGPCLVPSVQLFVDRAKAVAAGFACEYEQLDEVLEICRDLDGLPLAIEIAAAQVGVLQLSEIRSGLNDRLRLLRSRDRALPERQRTMEGLLGWSYQLLTETEQRAFRRLAVFGGSFSKEAAEAALKGEGIDGDDVPELIWTLVDKSLVTADLTDSATRYRLLESVQQYAMRLLIDNDDPVRIAVQLAGWLFDRVAPWLPNDRTWLGNVAVELPNIRAVVDFIAGADPETAQQLLCSVARYRDSVQSYRAGVDELTSAANLLQFASPSRVALLCELADLHLRMADNDAANVVLAEAAQLEEIVGPPDWNDVAVPRSHGEAANRKGDFAEVIRIAEDALSRNPSDRGTARMWSLIGIAQCSMGDLATGLVSLMQCLQTYLDLDDAPAIAIAHGNVAEAAWRGGNIPEAAHHQHACLEHGLAIGQQVAVAHSLIMAAHMARLRSRWSASLPLYYFAETVLTEAGHKLYSDEQAVIKDAFERAEAALGTSEVDGLIESALQMSTVTATELAIKIFCEEASTDSQLADHP